MEATLKSKGPWTHRAAIWLFAAAQCVLVYWLLGFVVNDIGSLEGPSYQDIEARMLKRTLIEQREKLTEQFAENKRQVANQEERQRLLRDSTDNSKQTMNQLLEFHRLSLEKGVEPNEAEQAALAEAEQRFLANQQQYQELNARLVELNEAQRTFKEQERELNATLAEAREPIDAEYRRLELWHQMKLAGIKLAVLVPLLVVAMVLFVKRRQGSYGPMIYAFGIAVAAKVTLVMHEHFPERYFKYILILVSLALVLSILAYLLRRLAFPKPDWLLKQYREAYERFFCPVCDFPIRRGPLRYVFWSRRSIKKLSFPHTESQPDEPYVCPLCSTQLFETCAGCGATRHALLPTCVHCGQTKSADQIFSAAEGARPATG